MATSTVYLNAANVLGTAQVSLTGSLNCMLVSSGYTPDAASDVYASVPAAHEITGTGYTAGGQSLGATTWEPVTSGSTRYKLTTAPTVWTNATVTFRYAVVYWNLGTVMSANPVLLYVDMVSDVVVTAQDLNIVWDATYGLVGMLAL